MRHTGEDTFASRPWKWFALLSMPLALTACGSWRLPNTALPGQTFSVVQGVNSDAVDDGTAVQNLNPPQKRILSIVAPSSGEQGVTQTDWEAGAVVLIPEAFLDSSEGRRAISPSVIDALKQCPTDLGSFANLSAWKAAKNTLKAGRVVIGNDTFYQFVIHRLRWKSRVSNTGRGYRVSDFVAETFGAARRVPAAKKLRTVMKVSLVAVDTAAASQAVAHLPLVNRDTVKAQCTNGTFDIQGAVATAPGTGWLRGTTGQPQPFNVLIEIIEEASL